MGHSPCKAGRGRQLWQERPWHILPAPMSLPQLPVAQSSSIFPVHSHPTAAALGREGTGVGGQEPVAAQLRAMSTEAEALLVLPASSQGSSHTHSCTGVSTRV